MKTAIFVLALIAIASCAEGIFDYIGNGADWTGTCATGKK